MANNLPFSQILPHGPFHAQFPVDFLNKQQIRRLSVIRPGYPASLSDSQSPLTVSVKLNS
jgi:hypothetical protein